MVESLKFDKERESGAGNKGNGLVHGFLLVKNARPGWGGRASVNFEFGLVAIEQLSQGLLRALPHLLPDCLARRAMRPGALGQTRHQ
jgi:hypothetical protein